MSNVHHIGGDAAFKPCPIPKADNPFRRLLEGFCALPPKSRLRVLKLWLAEPEGKKRKKKAAPKKPQPYNRNDPAFLLRNGLSRDLWERFGHAQDEAWRTEWPEWARREWAERSGKEPTP